MIRNCVLNDIPAVLKIENKSFPDPYPESLFLSFLERFPGGFRVAESVGTIAGYSVLLPLLDRDTTVITSLAVHPEFKRKKIGSTLLSDAISIAREIRAPSITLQVSVDNLPAWSLYLKFGFSKTRDIRDYYGKGVDGIEMQLLLKSS